MKIHTVTQGSPEWSGLRLEKRTASEASAMMNASKNTTRTQLLRLKKTGIEKEFSEWVQKNLLDKGHVIEAGARVHEEAELGEDLFPCTASSDEYPHLLASFDGVTMFEDVCWECKSWNETKAATVRNERRVPDEDHWQVVQQLVVSRAERCVYTVTDGTAERKVSISVTLDPADEKRLLAGWAQFDEDLAVFDPTISAEPAAIGRAPDNLPALRIEVTGMVTASNLPAFKDYALSVFDGINKDLVTDQDFANAESTVKWCGEVEDKLKAAKAHALSQTASIDELFRTIDAISDSARATRLELSNLVKARKEARRLEIKTAAEHALSAHIAVINKRLGTVQLPRIAADFAGAIKNKRTITSLQDSVDGELARAKIEANQVAEGIESNLALLRDLAKDHAFLFSDKQALVLKDGDAVAAIIKSRIAEHETVEKAKAEAAAEAARERIRQEERQRAEQQQSEAIHAAAPLAVATRDIPDAAFVEQVSALIERPANAPVIDVADSGQRIKLSDIGTRLGFSLTADFLRSLGIEPVGRERAAVLYREEDFARICQALVRHIGSVMQRKAA